MRNLAEQFLEGSLSRPWAVLAVICVTQFMVVMDFSIVNVALPAVRQQLGASAGEAQWVVGAYALCFCGFLLLGGRVSDAYGRDRVFWWAVLAFTVAAGAGGLASTPNQLIFARGAQGMAEAVITPAALSILVGVFAEGSNRNRALAIFGAATGLAVVSGVIIGGVLTDLLSWRWTMFVNVPIGLFVLILARLVLPAFPTQLIANFDVAGTLLFTSAIILIVLALTLLAEQGAGSLLPWLTVFVGFVFFCLFISAERRSNDPVLPLSFLTDSQVVSTNLAALMFGGVIGSSVFVLSQYLQLAQGLSPLETGLTMSAQGLAALVAAPLASLVLNRNGIRAGLIASFTLMLIANLLFFLVLASSTSHWARFLPALIISGAGATVGAVSVNAAATAGNAQDRQGLAVAVVNISQQLGIPFATAIVILVTTGLTGAPFSTAGAEMAFIVITGLAILGFLPASRLRRSDHQQTAFR